MTETAAEFLRDQLENHLNATRGAIGSMTAMAGLLKLHNPRRMTHAEVSKVFAETARFLEKLADVETHGMKVNEAILGSLGF